MNLHAYMHAVVKTRRCVRFVCVYHDAYTSIHLFAHTCSVCIYENVPVFIHINAGTHARLCTFVKLVRKCVSKQEHAYVHASFTFLRACYFIQTCIHVHLCKVDTYMHLNAGKVHTYTNNCSYARLVNIAWGWYLFELPVPHQLCFLSHDKFTDGVIDVCGLTEGIRSSRYPGILHCRPGSKTKEVYPSRAPS